MKRLFTKRLFALLMDVFAFAYFYETFRIYIATFISFTNSWGYFIVILPLIMRDLFFRNASLGKKLMGLVIVDEKWSNPSVFTVIKRTTVITSFGHLLLYRLRTLHTNMETTLIAEQKWELEHLKARVVEKKICLAIKEKATVNGYADIGVMHQLYEQYLTHGTFILFPEQKDDFG